MMTMLLMLWACRGGDTPPEKADHTGEPEPPFTHGNPTDSTHDSHPTAPDGEVAVLTAEAVADGGHLWVLAYGDRLPVTAELDGVPLSGRASPGYPTAAIFDVPDGHPAGTARLVLHGGEPAVREERTVEILPARFRRVDHEIGLFDVHDDTNAEAGCAQALTAFAWADIDLDGDLDALIGHYGPTSRVLLNDGAAPGVLPSFTEITGTGFDGEDKVANLSVADVDQDGDPDVFVGRRGVNRLYRNDFVETGSVGFTDITTASGLDAGVNEQRTMGGVWGDPDQDGDLDLVELNHTWCFPGLAEPVHHPRDDRLWINDGTGQFTDRSGVLPSDYDAVERHTFVGVWADHERDGDQDLFVISDFVMGGGPSILYRNDAPGSLQFTDASHTSGFAVHPDPLFKGVNGMGISVADIDHDGLPDFAVSNIGPNLLVVNGHGRLEPGYENLAPELGTTRQTLPWGVQSVTWATQMFDHDNDGDIELFYVGGNIRGAELIPHAFFDNVDGAFVERTFESGLSDPGHGKGSAIADIDNDGYLDVVVTNWAGELEVYRNTMGDDSDHHWLMVDLEGDGVTTHVDAFGGIVELTTPDDIVHTCFRTPSPSLSGSGDPACHFGLGEHDEIRELVVEWPDGRRESIPPPAVDQRVSIVDGAPR